MNSITETSIYKGSHSNLNDGQTRTDLLKRFQQVRKFSEELCNPLETEDYVLQTMPDVSPTKWHLAHTTWFWEAFVLKEVDPDYTSPNDFYDYFFNSYYVQVGKRWARHQRGLLSRPTVKEVYNYRRIVDERMNELISSLDENKLSEMIVTINIGLNHEQQHQELMLTDIKHVFAFNPQYPVYNIGNNTSKKSASAINWHNFEGGIVEIGYDGKSFFYDNEKPVHKSFLKPFQISSRLVTNAEFIDFIEDGGYSKVPLWLSNGAAFVESNNIQAPLYWKKEGNEWYHYTLNGFRKVNRNEPVCHVSFYEAEAFAHWADSRLPTEQEWEHVSNKVEVSGNFVDSRNYNPIISASNNGIQQLFGDVWEWTRSDYAPYPGYKVPPGAIGEYNGKFMSGQYVLRGGSCATSKNHIRNTYRNFFPPEARWQFMGIRLAKDIG